MWEVGGIRLEASSNSCGSKQPIMGSNLPVHTWTTWGVQFHRIRDVKQYYFNSIPPTSHFNTVDFRNFIVFFVAETLAHWNPTPCQQKHPQLICSDSRLSNSKIEIMETERRRTMMLFANGSWTVHDVIEQFMNGLWCLRLMHDRSVFVNAVPWTVRRVLKQGCEWVMFRSPLVNKWNMVCQHWHRHTQTCLTAALGRP